MLCKKTQSAPLMQLTEVVWVSRDEAVQLHEQILPQVNFKKIFKTLIWYGCLPAGVNYGSDRSFRGGTALSKCHIYIL